VTRKSGKEMTMDARFDYLGSPLVMKLVKHINSARAVLHDSGLPAATQELVKLRASQIGGEGLHRGRAGRAGARRAGRTGLGWLVGFRQRAAGLVSGLSQAALPTFFSRLAFLPMSQTAGLSRLRSQRQILESGG
jgi:hypothetical protein